MTLPGPKEAPAWASGGPRPVGTNLYLDDLNGWQKSLVECDFSQTDPKPRVIWSGKQVHEAVTPFVIVDGYLYGFWIDNREEAWALGAKPGNAGFSLRCTELSTGKLQWSRPGFRMGLSLNPLSYLIPLVRDPVYYGRLPALATAAVAVTWAVGALVLGFAVFTRLEPRHIHHL